MSAFISNPLILIPASTGSVFILAGWLMHKFPPKHINGLYGYRTAASMLTQERWDFSQTYAAKVMMKWGAILAACSCIGWIYKLSENAAVILGLGLILAATAGMIISVEKAIKAKFGKLN